MYLQCVLPTKPGSRKRGERKDWLLLRSTQPNLLSSNVSLFHKQIHYFLLKTSNLLPQITFRLSAGCQFLKRKFHICRNNGIYFPRGKWGVILARPLISQSIKESEMTLGILKVFLSIGPSGSMARLGDSLQQHD